MATDRHRDAEGLSPKVDPSAVILDTNFLFVPIRFSVDIFEELRRLLGEPLRCVVPRPVIDELRLLKVDAGTALTREVDFALRLAERCEIAEGDLEAGEVVDDHILRLAVSTGYPVATNDSELRRRLKGERVPVVYLRQRAYLEIDGFV